MELRLCYIAYPTSLTLRAANAIQTYLTCRELKKRADVLIVVPRLLNEPSAFTELGAVHLPRVPLGKLSRLWRTTLWNYAERTAFAFEAAVYLALCRLLRRPRCNAIYVRDVICAFWLAGLLRPLLGAPIAYEAHDLESRNPSRAKERWVQPLLRFADAKAIGGVAAIVSLTQSFKNYLVSEGQEDARCIFVVPDAYDDSLYWPRSQESCRAELGIQNDVFVIAYAGLTFAYRGLDVLLEAFRDLGRSDARLYLIGGREGDIAALREQATELGIESGVLFTGQVEPTRVTLYLNAADVLVIPDTVTDLTASPLKMFEYMAVAKPIVCVDLPALREILNDESAIFFPRRDVAALTRAIGRIAESPELAARLAQQAVTKACAYTYTARAARIVEALGSITKYR